MSVLRRQADVGFGETGDVGSVLFQALRTRTVGARGASHPTVTAVIPALNEALNLPHVLPKLEGIVDEVIIVDGLSVDGTCEIARLIRADVRIVEERTPGKGAALQAGFRAATGDIIVMLDADGSTDPNEIPMFVAMLVAGADYVKGSRFIQGGGTNDMPLHRRLGNAGLTRLVRLLFGGCYTDLCYGYNAFWADVLPYLVGDATGFEVETQMNINALKANLRIVEAPSFEHRRLHGDAKLRLVRDGLRVLKTIVHERRGPVEANLLGVDARHSIRGTARRLM